MRWKHERLQGKGIDSLDWCEDSEMVVVAYDEMWAEKIARQGSDDFRRARLSVEKINLDNEGIILIKNTGA